MVRDFPGHIRLARFSAQRGGFTLIEVMVSITIFVLIAAAVYASFSSVTVATDTARVGAEEMRLRQFLSRSLLNNLATAYEGYFSVAQPPGDTVSSQMPPVPPELAFVGTSEKSGDGARDALEFASSAPMMGTASPPGMLKRVRYEVTEDTESNLLSTEEQRAADEEGSKLRLTVTETALRSVQSPQSSDLFDTDTDTTSDLFGKGSPSWSVRVSSFDVAFFDGKDWVEEWDSQAILLMPWCVRIRINYARTEDEKRADSEEGIDAEEDPDYEVIVPLPVGAGTINDLGTWRTMVEMGGNPGGGNVNRNGTNGTDNDNSSNNGGTEGKS